MFFLEHIWLIPLLPACGAAIMFFFGRQAAEVQRSMQSVSGAVVLAF